MKKIWARISYEIDVTDEEWESLREPYGDEQEILEDTAIELASRGVVSNDSYIPSDVFDA